MTNEKESSRIKAVKYLLVIPSLAAVLLTVQASGLPDMNNHVQYPDTGNQAFINIRQYPDKVFSTPRPLVILDGKVISNEEMNKIDPKTIHSITVLKNIAAMDLYGEKAANGAILITLKAGSLQQPVNIIPDYRIRQGASQGMIRGMGSVANATDGLPLPALKIRGRSPNIETPYLIIVDGKELENGSLESISPNDIQSVEVIKNNAAVTVYGEKGKNGVVVITTKK